MPRAMRSWSAGERLVAPTPGAMEADDLAAAPQRDEDRDAAGHARRPAPGAPDRPSGRSASRTSPVGAKPASSVPTIAGVSRTTRSASQPLRGVAVAGRRAVGALAGAPQEGRADVAAEHSGRHTAEIAVHGRRGQRGDQLLPDSRQRRGVLRLGLLGAVESRGLDGDRELAGDALEEAHLLRH